MYQLLQRGFPTGSALSGYEANCKASIYDRKLAPYLKDVAEGGYILDLYCASDPMFIIRGPMVDVSLPLGATEKAPEIPDYMISGMSGGMKGLAKMVKAGYSSLDTVAVDIYCNLWQQRNARIGRRYGDVIQWSDGIVENIAESQCDDVLNQ